MEAAKFGDAAMNHIKGLDKEVGTDDLCQSATQYYREAFTACAELLERDKMAFQLDWFKDFYKRNYDALMVKSVYDNVVKDVENVRSWLDCLRVGAKSNQKVTTTDISNESNQNPVLPFLFISGDEMERNHHESVAENIALVNP